MRVLGIDFGEKRIGVAVADTTAPLATPKKTIKNNRRATQVIAKLVKEEGVKDVVVGLPKTMAGEEAEMAQKARAFGDALAAAADVSVHYVDERLSSEEAKKRGAKDVDAAAAATVLQSWLDRGRKI